MTYDDSIPCFPVQADGIHLRFTCPKCSMEVLVEQEEEN